MCLRLFSVICLMLFSPIWPEAGGWRGVVPLRSTRADVERLLGPPAKREPLQFEYDSVEERVFIQFSDGPCRAGREGGWDVPADTVTSVSVFPKKLPLSEVKLEPKRYERIGDPELPGVVHYVSRDEGVRYVVQGGKVEVVLYTPAPKDEHLLCAKGRV